MSVCLNPNDKSVQNFTEKFGKKSAGALAEAVNNSMIPLIKSGKKIFLSKLYSDILNNENVKDNVHALDIYLKVYSDEFQAWFKGDFDVNGEPVLYKNGKPIVNLINDKSLSASEVKTIDDMKSENAELFNKLIALMDSIGVGLSGFESYKHDYLLRTGYEFDGVALADMLNKVVLIKEGATIEDLAEEVGHFAIESLGVENTAVKAVLKDVESTEVYTKTLEEYENNHAYKNKDGSVNYDKLKKEAAGKLLSEALIKKNKELQESLPKRLLNNLKRILKALYAKIDKNFRDSLHRQINQSLGEIASDMLVGNFTEFKEDFASDEIFASLTPNSTLALVKEIKENKDFIRGKTKDGRIVSIDSGEEYSVYYNIKTEKEYKRVTNFISEEELEPNDFLISAQAIGNKVDVLVRDFFAGEITSVASEEILKKYDVGTMASLSIFLNNLEKVKKRMDANGEKVLANDIILYNDELGVAGTVDLLTYDDKGNFRIYDMKTMRGNNFTDMIVPVDKNGKVLKSEPKYDFKGYYDNKTKRYVSDKTKDSKREKHQKQLSLYRILLANTHGVVASSIGVIPIEVSYEPGESRTDVLKLLKYTPLKSLDSVRSAKINSKKREKANHSSSFSGATQSSRATNKAKTLALKTIRKLQIRLKFLERQKADPDTIMSTKKKIVGIKRAISEQEYEVGLLRFIGHLDKDLAETSEFIKKYKAGKGVMDYNKLLDMKTFLDYYSPLISEIRGLIRNDDIFNSEVYRNDILKEGRNVELREWIVSNLRDMTDSVEALDEFFKEESVNMFVKTIDETKHEADDIDARASAKEVVGDTSMMQYFFGSLANAKDSVLKIVQKILADINFAVNRHTLAVGKDLVSIYKKHGLTSKDTDSLYEVDSKGNATGYIINEFNLKAYDDSRASFSDSIHKKLGLLDAEGNPLSKEERDVKFSVEPKLKREWGAAWKQWLDKNTDAVDNWRDVVKERKSQLTEEQFAMWLDVNTTSFVSIGGTVRTYPAGELVVPKTSKYSSPAFKKISSNKGLMELREALLSTKREALLKQPAAYYNMEALYRLPQISKSFMQRVKMDKSIFKEFPELLKDEFMSRVDDDYEAQLQTRGDGTTVKVVPIRYNRALENTDDISRDIISSFIEYSHMAENFVQKNKATPKLQNVRDIVNNRTFKNSRGISEKGSKSNTLKALDKFLDMNLYGETKNKIEYTIPENFPLFGGKKINITKFVDKFHNYVRANNLVGNFFTAFVGATVGGMYSVIERLTGQYSSIESGRWAQKNFLSNFMEVFNAIGNPVQTNKMELMFEHHQVFDNAKEIFEDINKGRVSRIAGRKLIYGLYGGADYKMKGTMTMSIYDNYRLDTEEGRWYTKDEFLNRNYKDNKKEGRKAWSAMRDNSYWNAFETKFKTEGGKVVEGQVVVKDKFKKFINDDMINQMTARVRNINSRIDGVITEEDRAAVHQGTWGQLLATHRGWLFQGIAQRLKYKGVNYSTGQMEEGYFRTVGKALAKFIRYSYNPKQMMNMFEDWHNLDGYQRANLLRATYELGAIIGTYTAAVILNNMAEDEDEDDWTINFLAYMSTRALLETSIFVPPFVANELTSTLSNPIASARHVEHMVSIMDLMDTDDIRSGPYKGHSRAVKYLIKSTPGLRGWWEIRDPAAKNRFLKMKALKMYPGL